MCEGQIPVARMPRSTQAKPSKGQLPPWIARPHLGGPDERGHAAKATGINFPIVDASASEEGCLGNLDKPEITSLACRARDSNVVVHWHIRRHTGAFGGWLPHLRPSAPATAKLTYPPRQARQLRPH